MSHNTATTVLYVWLHSKINAIAITALFKKDITFAEKINADKQFTDYNRKNKLLLKMSY